MLFNDINTFELENVELVCFDFDGVFTNNKVIVNEDGKESVVCSRSDGLGLDKLKKLKIPIYILSSEKNNLVHARAAKLNINCLNNISSKIDVLKEICNKLNIEISSVLYLGNDINDLSCLMEVGFPVIVRDAHSDLKKYGYYMTNNSGGNGAVREICDLIYDARNQTLPKGKPTARFPESENLGERDWGVEELLVLSKSKYTLKKLFIKAGCKGGLQFHRKKDEAGYILSGEMIIRYQNQNGILVEKVVRTGDFFHFPNGSIHQEEAITDTVIIEVSTPYFNDRVRVDKKFGFDDNSGLPTTSIDEIIFK